MLTERVPFRNVPFVDLSMFRYVIMTWKHVASARRANARLVPNVDRHVGMSFADFTQPIQLTTLRCSIPRWRRRMFSTLCTALLSTPVCDVDRPELQYRCRPRCCLQRLQRRRPFLCRPTVRQDWAH
jgi:hypothetical protein